MTADTITVLHACGRRLAKTVQADDQIEGYDSARTFDLTEHPVADLPAVARLLAALIGRSDCAVVRGAIADSNRTRRVRRLLYEDKETGDAPTLRDVPRRCLALDMEDIPRPPDVPAADLAACARLALATLPAAFTGAACVVQASAGHGIKPGLRLRLWFWCSRPMTGTELKRWLRGTPADPSVFGAAQLIYTAAPIMGAGQADPIPVRLLVLDGDPVVTVPSAAALAPPQRAETAPIVLHHSHVNRYARAALVKAADRVMRADKRHPAIIAEARGLARLVKAGMLPENDLRTVLIAAARSAGKDDTAEVEKCIAWGLANPSAGATPEVSTHA
jgi:hypothetical protein